MSGKGSCFERSDECSTIHLRFPSPTFARIATARQLNLLLAAVGLVIVLASVGATVYFVSNLAREERAKVEIWLAAQGAISDLFMDESAANCDLTLHTYILESNTTIPMVLVGQYNDILGGRNFGEAHDADTSFLRTVIDQQQAAGKEPLVIDETRLYYLESSLLQSLRYYPIVLFALLATFVGFGYFAINSSRRAEQNRIWVGMAKETAHQLGTPISAIMAWVEYLKVEHGDNPELEDVATELTQDVDRLQLVAERFNKIGSTPELVPTALPVLLESIYAYMSRRAPRKVEFRLEVAPDLAASHIAVNKHLFDWVLENLIRNALDSMDGSGELVLAAQRDGKSVEITVKDSGKGIPSSKHKTVFRPGFTTKSRGWGLGLSLAKRIVEEYHGGKIFVKESSVGRGATFAVRMPVTTAAALGK